VGQQEGSDNVTNGQINSEWDKTGFPKYTEG
jgi:hypothetical protein